MIIAITASITMAMTMNTIKIVMIIVVVLVVHGEVKCCNDECAGEMLPKLQACKGSGV